MSLKRKAYVSLTIEQKLEALKRCDAGEKKGDVAKSLGIPQNSLSTIIKNRAKYEAATPTSKNMKRMRLADNPDLEEVVFKWFCHQRNNKVSISGPILQEKALFFAESLGLDNFSASSGWLDKFKKRYDITFRRVSGESADVSEATCVEWKEKLPALLESYSPADVFNADETAFFFKCLPDSTLSLKSEKCYGGMCSKERLTLLLGCNSTGTERLPALLIGKAREPRCFAGVQSFPVMYRSNPRACMTTELFQEWLVHIDSTMRQKSRNILLFIDNCPSHTNLPTLTNVKILFFPPNATSKLQPFDCGIIQNFKSLYRAELVRKITAGIDQNSQFQVNILIAMRLADKAWRSVKESTLANCFRKAGFPSGSSVAEEEEDVPDEVPNCDQITSHFGSDCCPSFEDFVTFDNDLAVAGMITDEELMADVRNNEPKEEPEEEDEDTPVEPPPSRLQAEEALATMRRYVECSSSASSADFSALHTLEFLLHKTTSKNMTQSTLDQFFH